MRRITGAATALVVMLAGCAVFLGDGPPANDVDRDRLAQVQADPTLVGATIERDAGKRQTSANFHNQRWALYKISHVANQWPDQDTLATAEQWATATELARQLSDDNWQFTAVTCSPNATFSILAVKEFDGFMAAMTSTFDKWSLVQQFFIPFHTESANPWSPGTALPIGTTCIEQPEPPTTKVGEHPEHNYQFGIP